MKTPSQTFTTLTPYSEGSIRELLAISLPLILSLLSNTSMAFFDRWILAQYDLHATNAAVVAGNIYGFFQYGAVGIAAISEVFVGQFNGARKLKRLGEPVWQMIWFSAMTACFFIPLGLWAGPHFISNPDYVADGIPYFKWLMVFGPAAALDATLSAFFIGRGQVKLVMITTIMTNLLNALLDYLLIFGAPHIHIPVLGASGAAIATGVAQAVQSLVLLMIFLSPHHRLNHGTGAWQFKPKLFLESIKIGLPSAVSSIVELSAWCFLTQILISSSELHMSIYSIGDSFFILFGFGFWGLQKGIISLVANYLGANRGDIVHACLRSGIKLVLGFMLILIIPFVFFPNALVEWFVNSDGSSVLLNEDLLSYGVSTMHWLWIYFMLDALAWILCGVLTASGDTRFVMILNSFSAWCCCVMPIYIFVVRFEGSPLLTWKFCALYGLFNVVCFSLRVSSLDIGHNKNILSNVQT